MTFTQFNQDLPQTDNFKSIVLNRTPLIDVRAPVEFQQGAFENAVNLPLMNNDERQQVGLCYKQKGNAEAVKLGHQLVNESVRAPRIEAWQAFMQAHPAALLYCFRGGMRSKIAQQWLADHGSQIVRLKGGYKAFRRYLIDYLDALPKLMQQNGVQPWVLAGRTGSGKTLILNRLNNAVDLEGLAHHRGSAFGRHATPQPTQIDFENRLAMALMRFMHDDRPNLVIEDESPNIGSVALPRPLFDALKAGKRIVVDTPLEERIEITFDEYVIQAQQEYPSLDAWAEFMQNAFDRIRKRLGGERHQRVVQAFRDAHQKQRNNGEADGHRIWIATLLSEYYDPMYDYQMQKHQNRIQFQGDPQSVLEFLQTLD